MQQTKDPEGELGIVWNMLARQAAIDGLMATVIEAIIHNNEDPQRAWAWFRESAMKNSAQAKLVAGLMSTDRIGDLQKRAVEFLEQTFAGIDPARRP